MRVFAADMLTEWQVSCSSMRHTKTNSKAGVSENSLEQWLPVKWKVNANYLEMGVLVTSNGNPTPFTSTKKLLDSINPAHVRVGK